MAGLRVNRQSNPRVNDRRGASQRQSSLLQLCGKVVGYFVMFLGLVALVDMVQHFRLMRQNDEIQSHYPVDGGLLEIDLQEDEMPQPLTPEEASGALGKLLVIPEKPEPLPDRTDTDSTSIASETPPAQTEPLVAVTTKSKKLKTEPKPKPSQPLALLHVGPMKTGTSTMQYGLKRYYRQLKQDNIISFPRKTIWTISTCIHKQDLEQVCKQTPEWKELEDFVEQAKSGKYHAVISHEGFWSKPMARELQKMFQDTHHVRILVAYRRWFEWLPSMYSQYHKHRTEWPEGEEKKEIPSLLSYLRLHMGDSHVTKKRKKMFLKDFDDIQLINIHANENLLQHFLCQILPDATKACHMPYEEGLKLNLKKTLNYRRLVSAAHQQGLVSPETVQKVPSAWYAAELAERFHKTEHEKTEKDLPLECLTDAEREELWNITVSWEHNMVPDFAVQPSSQESMRAKFDKSSKFALCDVNVTAALEQPEWKDFFGKLGTTYVRVPATAEENEAKTDQKEEVDASAEAASVAAS